MRILLAALTACTLVTGLGSTTAHADPWGYGPGRGYYDRDYGPPVHRRHRDRGFDAGDALVGGAIGLAAGALLGSALSAPQPAPAPRYVEPYGRPTYAAPSYVAPPTYEDTIPARTYRPARQARYYDDYGSNTRSDHVEACFARYRSYDPRSDTYLGHDGYRHRCNY